MFVLIKEVEEWCYYMFEIIPIEQNIRNKVVEFVKENWGSSIIVSKGKTHCEKRIYSDI